jgi:C_GCAxxG_C_C family probable redox protein
LGALAALDLKAFQASSGGQTGSMPEWTKQHLTEGYWSADSLFLSALKYLKQPEDLVRIATGFGGGMLQEDLCGYVTGGVMAVGLFAGAAKGSDKAARDKCGRLVKEYTAWWAQNYPLHCKDIKKPCDYKTMGNKASEFLQQMFERESKKG